MRLLSIVMVASISVLLAGCHACKTAKATPSPEPSSASKQPLMVTTPCAAPSSSKIAGQYPGAGDVRLEKTTPEFVYVNKPFDYRIEATNVGSTTLQNVVITDTVAKNLKINSSQPPISHSSNPTWDIGTLAPGEKKTITVNAVATGPSTISGCAQVTYDRPICAQIKVLEPQLSLAVTAPKEVLLCEGIPLSYNVKNTGSAEICGLQLDPGLPANVHAAQTDTETSMEMAKLAPAADGRMNVMVVPEKPGTYTFGGTLSAQNDITAKAAPITVNVVQPALKVETSAPESRYIGREAPVSIKVTNTGNGISRDTAVVTTVTGGVPSAPSEGGTLLADKVTWKLGTLNPGESREMSVNVNATSPAELQASSSASGYCSQAANASSKVLYKGVPGILLEMVDVSDPLLIGNNETYLITVTNQGSAIDRNIKVTCKLDGNMEYVSSAGPTNATVKEGIVEFDPLPALSPKARASWKVVVKGTKEADARFYTELTSEILTSPVSKTESTHFYK
jgi:uncharacterized repeat protein (TIGR01451 family)